MMKLLKLTLLITPSMANVERGFSILRLLITQQHNSLSPKSIDLLMRLVLLGPEVFHEVTWEVLVDKYKYIDFEFKTICCVFLTLLL